MFTFNKTLLCLCLSGLPITFTTTTYAGGGEEIATPTFDLEDSQYSGQNYPILYPSNDNRTNMMLMLSDLGLAKTIPFKVEKTSLWDVSSGLVPFGPSEFTDAAENQIPNKRAFNNIENDFYNEQCGTLKTGADTFINQLKKNTKISSNEKNSLSQLRNQIKECEKSLKLIQVNEQWSPTARQYASYLNGIILFYNTNYSSATKIFTALSQVEDPWLRETAQYMLIRTSLNELYSSSLGSYGDLDTKKVNQSLLTNFFNQITNYFKLYPKGQYTASARGFLRRGYWIANQQDALIKELIWQINNPKSDAYNLIISMLPAEIDRKVFGSDKFNVKQLNDPFLLATYDLMYMRKSDSTDYKPISWSQLNAQKEAFKNQPELFSYLQAVHLNFVQNKPQEALNYLPKQNPNSLKTYLELSQHALKATILEKNSDKNLAEQYWNNLISISTTPYQKSLSEIGLAIHYKNTNNQSAFLGNSSKIKSPTLQKAFITQIADANSLQQIITAKDSSTDKKNVALNVLLEKSLATQNFALFNKAYSWLPLDAAEYKSYDSKVAAYKAQPNFDTFVWNGSEITPSIKCPKLNTLTTALEKDSKNLTNQLCLGEYIRTKGTALNSFYGDYYYGPSFSNAKDPFTGATFSRGDVYKNIIKSGSKGDLQAYALYRAIMCYAPSGANDCGGKDVGSNVRKQWYDQIKRDYPNTSWAKSLKYYW